MKKFEWIITDQGEDTPQLARWLGYSKYEFIEGDRQAEIDLDLYSYEQIRQCLESYQYLPAKPNDGKTYSFVDPAGGIVPDLVIAECLFESGETPNRVKLMFQCDNCGKEWIAEQYGMHNDKCPDCNLEINPAWIIHEGYVAPQPLFDNSVESHFFLRIEEDVTPILTEYPSQEHVTAAMKYHRRNHDSSIKDGMHHLEVNWKKYEIGIWSNHMDDEAQWIPEWPLNELE